jgi:porin
LAGPDQVDNLIEVDATQQMTAKRFGFLKPYTEWKRELKACSGFGFGIDYTAVGLAANETLDDDAAASGMVRVFASWDLVRSEDFPGGLVFKGEHRHSYTNTAPNEFALNIGHAGLFEPPFSEQGFRLTNLYWRQGFLKERIVLLGGYIDATDFVDVYAMASPWLHFMNFAFSNGSASLAVPNEGLGFALGAWITDNVYVLANISDANAIPSEPGKTFGRFFSARQYFKSFELGWSAGRERAYFDNVHATLWHTDASQEHGTPSGWGIAASGT